jgi:hypothetical protein
MSLQTSSASTFTQTNQFVAQDSANVTNVNHVLLSAVVKPATSGAGACITGPGTSAEQPSILFTSEPVPAGAVLRGFSIGVIEGNPGVITGVGVYDRATHEYTNLYNLYSREVVGGVNEEFVTTFRREVELTSKESMDNLATSAITLSAITSSKVLLRPLDSIVYAPLHPITSGGSVLNTGKTTSVMPVLAFAGYSPVPADAAAYAARRAAGKTTPGAFRAGGTFTAKATFDWYTASDA